MLCKGCGKEFRLKSNKGVGAELDRISAYLEPTPEPSCPNAACANHGHGFYAEGHLYTKHDRRGGSGRLRCRACRQIFTVSVRAISHQRTSHANRTVFAELVTKKPIRGIAQVTRLDPATIYDKIDFIHSQCLGFAGEREREIENLAPHSLTLCVDS